MKGPDDALLAPDDALQDFDETVDLTADEDEDSTELPADDEPDPPGAGGTRGRPRVAGGQGRLAAPLSAGVSTTEVMRRERAAPPSLHRDRHWAASFDVVVVHAGSGLTVTFGR